MKIEFEKLSPLEYLEIKDRISKMDDDTTIGPDIAAVYLDMSEKTLATHRQKGCGPEYIQPKTTAARNQSVSYKMRSLRDWQKQNSFKSSIEAAGARGLCREIGDLFGNRSFWIDDDGRMLDIVSEESARELVEADISAKPMETNLADALRRRWGNSRVHKALFDQAEAVLDEWRAASKSFVEEGTLKQMQRSGGRRGSKEL